ncbi:MAG: ABC transporter permease [Ardenticatenia bacterium]|nr:ABC transporter permease [Ardenticatenia bacterium]
MDLGLALVPVPVLWWLYGHLPSWRALTLPMWLVLAVAATLGTGAWLSALNVQYRDVRHLVPFLVQVWFFATPVVYPGSLVPLPWRYLYALNPMVGVVEGFRWALVNVPSEISVLAISTGTNLFLLVSGVLYFRHAERTFCRRGVGKRPWYRPLKPTI